MRLYGKRFLKNAVGRQVESHAETKDAICWDVLPAQRLARCKIQGSNEYVIAHYPQNWNSTPVWLKPGNAVRITHTGGTRNRIELSGHGTYIPTPVTGLSTPTPTADSDAIISGCKVLAITNVPQMMVMVTAGSYRIAGTTYVVDAEGGPAVPIPMEDPATMEMGDDTEMGTIVASGITIDPDDPAPIPSGNYRYGLIVVGTDGAYHYVPGTAAAVPVAPDVPDFHLECGRILLYHGMTKVEQIWIDKEFTTAEASELSVLPADDELAWAELTTDVAVQIIDQYGEPLSPPAGSPWFVTMEFLSGNGKIDGIAPPGTVGKYTSTDTAHFTYTRNQTTEDSSPTLQASLALTFLLAVASITLLDESGDPMY